MFSWIFLAVFLFFALLFIGVGMLKGRKFVWVYSALKLVTLILAAVASMLLSAFLARFAAEFAYDKLIDLFFADGGTMLDGIASAPEIVSALIAMIVAPILFLPLFWIIRPILNIFARNC